MAAITQNMNIDPKTRRYLNKMNKAMSGDMIITIDTANVTPAPTSEAWSYTVIFRITDALGKTHDWYSGNFTAGIADDSSAGTASIDDATPAVVNGTGKVVVSGDAEAWLDTEVATLSISPTGSGSSIMGNTIAQKQWTATFTAV